MPLGGWVRQPFVGSVRTAVVRAIACSYSLLGRRRLSGTELGVSHICWHCTSTTWQPGS